MNYSVTLAGTIEAESEERAYDLFLEYMADCVIFDDVTGFDFAVEEGADEV